MTTNEAKVAVRRRGEVAVLDIAGDIDRDAAAPLQRAFDEAVAEGGATVLLNFGEVGYINSTGIAVIVGLLARARTERRAISACGLTDHYRHVFSITRLSDFMSVYSDEDSAVGGSSVAGSGHGEADIRATSGGGE